MVAVITTVPIMRVAMSAPVLQTLFWELMVEAVNAWTVILQKTILHVKVGILY